MPRKRSTEVVEEKELIIPKPGQMVKTCHELCRLCAYGCSMGNTISVTCDYLLLTGKLRIGCREGGM